MTSESAWHYIRSTIARGLSQSCFIVTSTGSSKSSLPYYSARITLVASESMGGRTVLRDMRHVTVGPLVDTRLWRVEDVTLVAVGRLLLIDGGSPNDYSVIWSPDGGEGVCCMRLLSVSVLCPSFHRFCRKNFSGSDDGRSRALLYFRW